MLTFDKIKLVAAINAVEVVDASAFITTKERGITKSMKVSLSEPYAITMEINYSSREFILEFTGKILGKDYPQLISRATIALCFEKINELGICRVDPEAMMSAEVVKCDVTKDIMVDNVQGLTKWLRANISNYQTYSCRILANKNAIIEKNVCSAKRKKRMTIYNKETEMSLSRERDFVTENGLTGKFNGKCRFELNLCSKQQIRDALGTTGNTLAEVLGSSNNPIYDFMNDVIADTPTQSLTGPGDWKQYMQRLVLQDCDYDLARVEAKLRQYKDPRSARIPKMMRPYRELLATGQEGATGWNKDKLLSALG